MTNNSSETFETFETFKTLTGHDKYGTELQVVVNAIADLLKDEAAKTEDPEVQSAWVRAEVGREAVRLGVAVHDRVLLDAVLQDALRVEPGGWHVTL